LTPDLKKITVPTLVMHGDDDQIVPYADSGPLSAKLVKGAILKTYKGFPHGMPCTQGEVINADLLAFINGELTSGESQTSRVGLFLMSAILEGHVMPNCAIGVDTSP